VSLPPEMEWAIMNEFKTYHPIVNFLYFVLVIGFSMFLMHPICLSISLGCSFSYSILLKGKCAIWKSLSYMLPMLLIMALMNPAFSHEGITILGYFPSGNPLTLESAVYGLASGVMLVSVLCWFSCYNMVMTSDKFIYLFGKLIPALSLILSMTLRFVPTFASQLRTVSHAQRCMGRDITRGTLLQRAKHGLTILSIMITWSLEHAIETADSMKARGYGLSGRTAFSIFVFDRRDKITFLCLLTLGIYVLTGSLLGGLSYRYFPSMASTPCSVYSCSLFAAYLLLCSMPIIIEVREVRKWNSIKSKI